MNSYHKGRAFEYRVINKLKNRFPIIIRSAGSHSPFDIICVSDKEIWFIQCKNKFVNIAPAPIPPCGKFFVCYPDEGKVVCESVGTAECSERIDL